MESAPNMTMASPAPAAYTPDQSNASPIDAVERHDFGAHKHRRYSSTGGGRAWTEQEEVYLLQTRLQKMPYKHIAAHLKKTELACRLHYHQLSHGTNRRKRAASVSSCSSGPSPMTPDQRMSPEVEFSAVNGSRDQSPIESGNVRLWNIKEDVSQSCSASPQMSQKPLLPKPITAFPHHARAINKALRLDCRTTFGRSGPVINKERLREVYEAHRVSFWKMIAADYGEGVSPAVLEEVWRDGGAQGMETPDSTMDDLKMGAEAIRRMATAPGLVQSERERGRERGLERGFSPINRAVSASPAPYSHSRSALTLPTPTPSSALATTISASSARPAAIANLLTENIDTRRSPKANAAPISDRDAPMQDATT